MKTGAFVARYGKFISLMLRVIFHISCRFTGYESCCTRDPQIPYFDADVSSTSLIFCDNVPIL
jgi:hypothetical protein